MSYREYNTGVSFCDMVQCDALCDNQQGCSCQSPRKRGSAVVLSYCVTSGTAYPTTWNIVGVCICS